MARKISISTQVIGLVKKIFRLPPEIINAFLILDSRSGANTKDNIIGAVGYPFFCRKYATIPESIIINTPYIE